MSFDFGQNRIKRIALAVLILAVFLVTVGYTIFGAETYVKKYGVITTSPGIPLNVRADASTGTAVVCTVNSGDTVIVMGEKRGETIRDTDLWYLVEVNNYVGYVTAHYVEITGEVTTAAPDTSAPDGETTSPDGETTVPDGETTTPDGETTAPDGETTEPEPFDFEAYLDEQKFPESYKPYLRELHSIYPNWVFKAHHTGFDFNYAVSQQLDKSLVENSFPSSWKSIEDGAYNWETNQWLIYDGDRWVRASKEVIMHYMDPRNFLGVNSVFQFLDQSYDPEVQTIEGVKRVIAGTFMENDVIDADGTTLNYAEAIFNAGTKYKVNPYVLSSMIIIEVGSQGSSIISGTYPGYAGYYNYYNIGAYTANGMNPIQRGLWYAKGGWEGSTSYLRPWNTRLKAIDGGAYFYADGYITVGQNTLYLKRFNVQGNYPFTHQYMTSAYGPAVEATKLATGYTQELRETPLSFYIPVYENMPAEPCPQPKGDGSPNMKLSSLSVEGYTLTPDFNPDVLEYMLVLPPSVNSININAVKMEGTAKVEGTGLRAISDGNTVFEIKVTAGNGTVRTYKLTVAKENSDTFGDVNFTNNFVIKNMVVPGISPTTSVSDFKSRFITLGDIVVKKADGTVKNATDAIVTGDTIEVFTTNGVSYAKYTAAVKGDIDGDGNVNVGDLLKVRNKMLGTGDLTDIQMLSGDIDGDGTINIGDLLKIRNHTLGTALL